MIAGMGFGAMIKASTMTNIMSRGPIPHAAIKNRKLLNPHKGLGNLKTKPGALQGGHEHLPNSESPQYPGLGWAWSLFKTLISSICYWL